MTKPKPLYIAEIAYRTPSGRKVIYSKMVAANDMAECESELRARLDNECRFGKRKVSSIIGEFSARFFTMQIATR